MRLRRMQGSRMRVSRISVGYRGQRTAPPHVSLLGMLGAATAWYDESAQEQVEHMAVQATKAVKRVMSGHAGAIASAMLLVNAEIWDMLMFDGLLLPNPVRAWAYRVGLGCMADEAVKGHSRRIAVGVRDPLDDVALLVGFLNETMNREASGSLGDEAVRALQDDSLAQRIMTIADGAPLLTLARTVILLVRAVARTLRQHDPQSSKALFSTGVHTLTRYVGMAPGDGDAK